jgi:hypothetical protein
MAEDPNIHVTLDRLEQYLGKKIQRITHPLGLYGLVEHYNGYLPSSQSRWCTRELKLKPFTKYLATVRSSKRQDVWTFVGIRADETQRIGLISHEDSVHTEMPFRDLGIGRAEVFQILEKTVQVPKLYQTRTRSGCSCCPFQRRSEVVGLLRTSPKEFDVGMSYEKISEQDIDRFSRTATPLWHDSGVAENHLGLPVPQRIDVRYRACATKVEWKKLVGCRNSPGSAILWVGAEFFIHPGVGGNGVWWQDIVTFSNTRGGLVRQMQSHYEHRIQTPEANGLSVEEMKDELKLAVYQIRVSNKFMKTHMVSKKPFTWRQGESYAQIKHLYSWAKRTLQVAGMQQTIKQLETAKPMTFGHEYREGHEQALQKITLPYGEVIGMDLFTPRDEIREVLDEKLVACFHCSI